MKKSSKLLPILSRDFKGAKDAGLQALWLRRPDEDANDQLGEDEAASNTIHSLSEVVDFANLRSERVL